MKALGALLPVFVFVFVLACGGLFNSKPSRARTEPDQFEVELASIVLGLRETVGKERHAVGDPVEAKWDKDGNWYPGTIVKLNRGSVDVRWTEDNTIAKKLDTWHVRRVSYPDIFACADQKHPQLVAFCKLDCKAIQNPDLAKLCAYDCNAITNAAYKQFCKAHATLTKWGAQPTKDDKSCHGILEPDVLDLCYDMRSYQIRSANAPSSGGSYSGGDGTGTAPVEDDCVADGQIKGNRDCCGGMHKSVGNEVVCCSEHRDGCSP